jgi:hypothetical protein
MLYRFNQLMITATNLNLYYLALILSRLQKLTVIGILSHKLVLENSWKHRYASTPRIEQNKALKEIIKNFN